MAGDEAAEEDAHSAQADYDDDGYKDYVEDTLDPGPWLLVLTTLFCFGAMLLAVPLMVRFTKKQRKEQQTKQDTEQPRQDYANMMMSSNVFAEPQAKEAERAVEVSAATIVQFDKETRKILWLAIPFTLSAVFSSSFSNICLALVGRHIGTHALSAYALVEILVGLMDGILGGPISACTTLCSHAVGASNNYLAGQYVQLAILFYLLSNIPMIIFWWHYMAEIVLYLEWGDEETAAMAEDFVRVYIWSYLLGGVSSGLWQILEVAGHAIEGTIFSLLWGGVNVVVIGILVTTSKASLYQVGMAYNVTAAFFIVVTGAYAEYKGWLDPFKRGLFHSIAFKNGSAVKLMMKQALPLSFGSFLSNAEWAILTFFASYLGPAEVAAWAILGSIWDIFYSCTSGISDAAEIRAACHFGENNPSMAKLSGYKSLLLSMTVAAVVSCLYISLQSEIPAWFTVDETLQAMLTELVPFVGVANLCMQFGMTSWALIGAQGKYKLATWVSFISSWGVTMPMAAFFVYVIRFDLQGITSAVVIGYVSTGAALSYFLLTTDWEKTAQKIQERNAETASGEAAPAGHIDGDKDADEELYASLRNRSSAAKAAARRNIRLLTIPPGKRSGIIVGNIYSRPGTYILTVRNWSPLHGSVRPGDSILALDEQDVRNINATEIASIFKATKHERCDIAVASAHMNQFDHDDDDVVLFETIAEDYSSDVSGDANMPPFSTLPF